MKGNKKQRDEKEEEEEEEDEYVQLVFSSDSKYLVARAGLGRVEVWSWERCRLEASSDIYNPQQKNTIVYHVRFIDPEVVVSSLEGCPSDLTSQFKHPTTTHHPTAT